MTVVVWHVAEPVTKMLSTARITKRSNWILYCCIMGVVFLCCCCCWIDLGFVRLVCELPHTLFTHGWMGILCDIRYCLCTRDRCGDIVLDLMRHEYYLDLSHAREIQVMKELGDVYEKHKKLFEGIEFQGSFDKVWYGIVWYGIV